MNRLYLDEDRSIEAQISSDASLQTDEINHRNKNDIGMRTLGFYFSLYCQETKKQLSRQLNETVRQFYSYANVFIDEQSESGKNSEQENKMKEMISKLRAWKTRIQQFQQNYQSLKKNLPSFEQKKKMSKFQDHRKVKFIEILNKFLSRNQSTNIYPSPVQTPSKIQFQSQLTQIHNLYDRSHYYQAIAKAKSILQKMQQKSTAPQVNFILANCYKAVGQYQSAIEQYNKAIKINPRGCYFNNRGNCYLCLQKINEAESDYKKAIQFEPNNEVFLGNYGNVCLSLKKFEQSIELYDKAINLGSENDFFYNNRAFALIKLKQYDKAIDSYSIAIELNPYNHVYLKNRANLYMQKNMRELALHDIDKAINIEPNKHQYYYLKGKWQYLSGLHKQAMYSFKRACELEPKKSSYKQYYNAIKAQFGYR